MKPFNQLQSLSPNKFKRLTGISRENFESLRCKVDDYKNSQKAIKPITKRGRKPEKIFITDCILLTLYYMRHYPTFDNLCAIFGISESYCQKIYSRYARIIAEVETLPNRKELIDNPPDTLIIDVSEQPIERPVKHQKDYYSGKKTRHTIKAQLIICALTLTIMSVICGKGRQHDFSVLKINRLFIHPKSLLLADSGYQGLQKLHKNTTLPHKKKKGCSLTAEEKAHNKALSKQRIFIENVNRRCKVFRIVKEVYRGKHKNYSLTWRLVAALVNLRYDCVI